ncbi:hypothetical protein I7I51_02129 [Histoplasma capsulatum]|uniref:Uncharacterized protein n=1 Tax=Ajellomyces capsulatus TaxID=5037 RepID=A0A8A1MD09_AJECA|nr:hypothetical protein I7I51_02129 [Histoplasma capsulatum]
MAKLSRIRSFNAARYFKVSLGELTTSRPSNTAKWLNDEQPIPDVGISDRVLIGFTSMGYDANISSRQLIFLFTSRTTPMSLEGSFEYFATGGGCGIYKASCDFGWW